MPSDLLVLGHRICYIVKFPRHQSQNTEDGVGSEFFCYKSTALRFIAILYFCRSQKGLPWTCADLNVSLRYQCTVRAFCFLYLCLYIRWFLCRPHLSPQVSQEAIWRDNVLLVNVSISDQDHGRTGFPGKQPFVRRWCRMYKEDYSASMGTGWAAVASQLWVVRRRHGAVGELNLVGISMVRLWESWRQRLRNEGLSK
jgi:hypothetical protein